MHFFDGQRNSIPVGNHLRASSTPEQISLKGLIDKAKESRAFIFTAMHGGEGGTGLFRNARRKQGIAYNGSDSYRIGGLHGQLLDRADHFERRRSGYPVASKEADFLDSPATCKRGKLLNAFGKRHAWLFLRNV